jgi:uncharacterized protein (TIGR02598 family)
MRSRTSIHTGAFSLVEVVLALGVISFAIVAILGVIPAGLNTGHSAQDETRASHIAQGVITALSTEASSNFQKVPLPGPTPAPTIDLSQSTTIAAPAAFLYADNNGQILAASAGSTGARYSISIATDNFSTTSLPPLETGYANKVTVRIVFPPLTSAGATPNAAQTVRDYVQVITKF